MAGRGIAREGAKVLTGKTRRLCDQRHHDPLWGVEGRGLDPLHDHGSQLRSICLAYIDSDIVDDTGDHRYPRQGIDAVVVPYHHARSMRRPMPDPSSLRHGLAATPAEDPRKKEAPGCLEKPGEHPLATAASASTSSRRR